MVSGVHMLIIVVENLKQVKTLTDNAIINNYYVFIEIHIFENQTLFGLTLLASGFEINTVIVF